MEILIENGRFNGIGKKLYFEGLNCFAEILELSPKKGEVKSFFNNIIKDEIACIREFDCEDVEDCSDEYILKNYSENFNSIYGLMDKCDNDKLIFLDFIANDSGIKGLGEKLLNYLKDNYKYILLYPTADAEDYWIKKEFQNCFLDYYLWERGI